MEPTSQNTVAAGKLAAPQQSEIARLLEELSLVTGGTQEEASMLQDQLRPVLRNEPQKDIAGSPEQPTSTDMGQFLVMIIDRLRSANRTLADSRNRLEL